MNSQIFTSIVLALIGVIGAIVSSVLIPYLKEKIGEVRYNNLVDFIYRCVNAANQIYTPEEWQTKKNYVLGLVQGFLNTNAKIDLSDEKIDALIEGFVKEAKNIQH